MRKHLTPFSLKQCKHRGSSGDLGTELDDSHRHLWARPTWKANYANFDRIAGAVDDL